MAYNASKDKLLKKVGKIVLVNDKKSYQAINVRIRKYASQDPKVAITHERTSFKAEKPTDTWEDSKFPRLIGEDMKEICKKLPKLLIKAQKLLDELS